MVLRYGGVSNRPGTQFVSEVSYSNESVRLVPFIFNQEQTYILEFGHLYMRVYQDGNQVTDLTLAIENITSSLGETTVTVTGHGLLSDQEVFINGIDGAINLNNRNYKVDVVDANNFKILEMDFSPIDSSVFPAYTGGGEAKRIYEIETPYFIDEVKDFKYVQSADIITFAHPSAPPQELLRFGTTNWVFQELNFVPSMVSPSAVGLAGGVPGDNTYKYIVTAVDSQGVESLAGTGLAIPGGITAISNTNPIVVTTGAAHDLDSGDTVFLDVTPGMPELEGKYFPVDVISSTQFELRNSDGDGFGTFSGTGVAFAAFSKITSQALPTSTDPIIFSYTSVEGAFEYNIYQEVRGSYGLLGVTSALSFNDIGQSISAAKTPPVARYPFLGVDNYPSVVTYIQQRLAFANTNNDTEQIYLSKTSDYYNFSTSRPSQSNDSISFQMVGRQVNAVKNLLDLGSMIILTSSGEWSAAGGSAGVITPTEINTKQYSYNGSGDLQPIIIDGAAIYQQARGSIIRDLNFDYQVDGYRGNDLTIFSSHLFDKFTIVDWAYQQIPHSILWVVRSDGVLLGMTFVRNQEIRAWHRHDLGGQVESIAIVPEGNEDYVYVQVKRLINGKEVRYIEKLNSRLITDIKDSIFMDSTLSYDGRNNSDSTGITISGGTTWEYTETIQITSNIALFDAGDVGNEIQVEDPNDGILRCAIVGYVDDFTVNVKPKRTVPESLRDTYLTKFTKAVDRLVGLWHLEGKEVSVFGDGYVVASPNNESYVKVTVNQGEVILDKPYGVIHIGLPYLSDIETLDIDTANGETIADKDKIVNKVNMFVEDTRGLWSGPKPPSDDSDDPLEGLTEVKVRNEEDYDTPVSLKTDVVGVNIEAEWNSNGRVFIRQVDPIPMSILSISPAGKYPISP